MSDNIGRDQDEHNRLRWLIHSQFQTLRIHRHTLLQTRTPGQYGQYGNVCFILVFSVSYYSQYEKPVRNTFREQRFRVRPLPVRKRPKPVRIVRNQYGKNKMKLFKTALGWLSPAGPWPVRTVRNQYETSTEIFGGSCKETNRAIWYIFL